MPAAAAGGGGQLTCAGCKLKLRLTRAVGEFETRVATLPGNCSQ